MIKKIYRESCVAFEWRVELLNLKSCGNKEHFPQKSADFAFPGTVIRNQTETELQTVLFRRRSLFFLFRPVLYTNNKNTYTLFFYCSTFTAERD